MNNNILTKKNTNTNTLISRYIALWKATKVVENIFVNAKHKNFIKKGSIIYLFENMKTVINALHIFAIINTRPYKDLKPKPILKNIPKINSIRIFKKAANIIREELKQLPENSSANVYFAFEELQNPKKLLKDFDKTCNIALDILIPKKQTIIEF